MGDSSGLLTKYISNLFCIVAKLSYFILNSELLTILEGKKSSAIFQQGRHLAAIFVTAEIPNKCV